MLNVELTYNPYLVATLISVEGKELPEDHDLMCQCKNNRLQVWIDSFLANIVSESRENKIDLVTNCTPQDTLDVKDALTRFQASENGIKVQINLKANECCKSAEDKINQLTDLFQKAQSGPFEEFKSTVLKKRFEEALSPSFEVSVVATMSSGKSTVINSFIGQDLMPAKNEACTATIANIEDCDGMDVFEGCSKDSEGNTIHNWQPVTQDILTNWNDDSQTSTMHLKGDIKSIQESDCATLVLVDTPGPNNSRDDEHQKTTLRAIKRKPLSMVLYVLNATQMNITDDQSLLNTVSEAMKQGGRQAQDRFIFIANKIDAFDPEKGESVRSALKNARNYLKENGIENPLVIPASGELAKLIRMEKKGCDLTRSQRNSLNSFTELFVEEDEMNMLNHVQDRINPYSFKRLSSRLDESKTDRDKAEILSGIPIVEELLNDFLIKHALPAKIKDAVDTFGHVMEKAEGIKRINVQLSKSKEELEKVAQILKSFEKNNERVSMAKNYRKEVSAKKYEPSNELKDSYKQIQKKMFFLIEDMTERFDLDNVKPMQANRIIDGAASSCNRFNIEIEEIINESLEKDFLAGLDSLREGYEAHITKLLQKEFPSTQDAGLVEFQKKAMTMPNAKTLVEENKYTEKVVVGTRQVSDSKWYNPFSWGSKKTVHDYEHHDYVDMSPIWNEMRDSLHVAVDKNINESKKHAADQAEKGKRILLQAMDGIDRVCQENITKIQDANSDKDSKEKQIAENKSKLQWYEEFSTELKEVLSI
ncbi:dynamin family protein [Maridesulfovibrio ferrireducens]|uniref:dynamin family protein n=1 Tax=Maridesulfovibrio ferrireducens TaxID=246191 RepID=UPI001A361C42|nr:dynamin family protein [Maridesulfovibrio ferrireducens]MBI9109962.1 dynamin family protein [Maridesulfovibrio ferrireducens]